MSVGMIHVYEKKITLDYVMQHFLVDDLDHLKVILTDHLLTGKSQGSFKLKDVLYFHSNVFGDVTIYSGTSRTSMSSGHTGVYNMGVLTPRGKIYRLSSRKAAPLTDFMTQDEISNLILMRRL